MDDYFAGSLASPRPSGPPAAVPSLSTAPSGPVAFRPPPQVFSVVELAVVGCCAAVGVAAVLAWGFMGHPHTRVWRVVFGVGLWVPLVVALLSPAGLRRHRFGVGACSVFVGMSSVRITAALWGLGNGWHTGRIATDLLTGVPGLALFGGAPLATRRLWGPDRTLSPEMAHKAELPPAGKQARRVWLVLQDGRRIAATVVYGRQLARLPRGVSSSQVVDVQSR